MKYILLLILLFVPGVAFGECRVVEYSDRNEVVCDEQQNTITDVVKFSAEAYSKNFIFYSTKNPKTKISVFADFSPKATANPGATLFSYVIDLDENTSFVWSFKFVNRTGENTFEINELHDYFDKKPTLIKMYFDKDVPYRLPIFPTDAGCELTSENNILLKMISLTGSQLNYQIIIPACLKNVLQPYKK